MLFRLIESVLSGQPAKCSACAVKCCLSLCIQETAVRQHASCCDEVERWKEANLTKKDKWMVSRLADFVEVKGMLL